MLDTISFWFYISRSLIEESNRLREKRLNESKAAASVTSGVALNPSTQGVPASDKSIQVLDASKPLLRGDIDVVEEDAGNSDTMIQRSNSSSMVSKNGFEW